MNNKIENIVNMKIILLYGLFVLISGLMVFVGIVHERTLVAKDLNFFRRRYLKGSDVALTFNNMVSFMNKIGPIANNLQYVQFSLTSTSDYFHLWEIKSESDFTNSINK